MTESFNAMLAEVAADPTMLDARPAFAPIPNGAYHLHVNSAEEVPYVAGAFGDAELGYMMANPSVIAGKKLKVEFEIIDDGEYKGRKIKASFITVLSSDQGPRKQKSPAEILKSDRGDMGKLYLMRAKVTADEITSGGYGCLTGRSVFLYVKQSLGKTGYMNYYPSYDDAGKAGAHAATAPKTVRPTLVKTDSDDAPF